MDIQEVLQVADQLIFTQTGKHIDDLQKAVVKGVWQRQSYETIAEESHRSESRIREVAYKLWRILSQQLGEDVNKSNFRSAIERLQITSSQIDRSFNFCTENLYQSQQNTPKSDLDFSIKSAYQDLELAPHITNFCGRNHELKTLSKWLLNSHTQLIGILGLSGIGKTILVKRFIDLHTEQFDILWWKSLKYPQPLNSLLTQILTKIKAENNQFKNIDGCLNEILSIFKNKKCLLILDNVENLFIKGQFAGQYQTEYLDYQNFFQTLTQFKHQSNVILISQEKCQEMTCFNTDSSLVKTLELHSLNNVKILSYFGLENQQSWSNLLALYDGNPLYLELVSVLIKEVFQGNISDFLEENTLILTEE
jgi:hypothetical protein